MKEFWIYTAARFGLFLGCYAVLALVWYLFNGTAGILFLPAIAALLVSMMLSWRLLKTPRERFASVVQNRAERASSKFDEMKAREDVD